MAILDEVPQILDLLREGVEGALHLVARPLWRGLVLRQRLIELFLGLLAVLLESGQMGAELFVAEPRGARLGGLERPGRSVRIRQLFELCAQRAPFRRARVRGIRAIPALHITRAAQQRRHFGARRIRLADMFLDGIDIVLEVVQEPLDIHAP